MSAEAKKYEHQSIYCSEEQTTYHVDDLKHVKVKKDANRDKAGFYQVQVSGIDPKGHEISRIFSTDVEASTNLWASVVNELNEANKKIDVFRGDF
jgi:hypothetical protein